MPSHPDERNRLHMSAGNRHDAVLARSKLLLLLTFSSGSVGVICFLGLGRGVHRVHDRIATAPGE